MGLNVTSLDNYINYEKQGWMPRKGCILDIGAQQINATSDPESLDRYITHFGGDAISADERARISDNGFVGDLHIKAGFRYRSFDVTSDPHVIKMDMNFGKVPFFHRRKYNLVTNHGTTEHILNQMNCMKIIHDATTSDGIMLHIIPMVGDCEHGILNYNPKFFWALADANEYRILHYSLWVNPTVKNMADIMVSGITLEKPAYYTDAWGHVLLQKTNNKKFRVFNDPAFKY